MYQICKSFTFEAAHQLEAAYTKACHECVHGHSYTVELYVASLLTDENRMVIDFGELKGFKDEVMSRWDHGVLFHAKKRPHIQPLIDAGVWKASKVNFLEENPTAEYMARVLFYNLRDFLQGLMSTKLDRFFSGSDAVSTDSVWVSKVRVHETATGWAEYMERRS